MKKGIALLTIIVGITAAAPVMAHCYNRHADYPVSGTCTRVCDNCGSTLNRGVCVNCGKDIRLYKNQSLYSQHCMSHSYGCHR